MASSWGRANAHVSASASSGMTVNWVRQPTRMSLGRVSTTLKSWGESVRPMPNMMAPSMGLIAHVSIHANDAGTSSATMATSRTRTSIRRTMNIFFVRRET